MLISEMLSLNIMENVPGHIFCKDKNGVYLWCNKEQLTSMGLDNVSQFIGKTDFDTCDKSDAEKIRETDLRIIRTGKAELVEEEVKFINSSNKKAVPFLSYKAPFRDTKGEIIGIIGNSIMITEQKALEVKLLRENYNKTMALENIIANLPAHIYWKDENGVVLGCNDKQAQSIGFKKASDIIGKTDFDCLNRDVAEIVRKNDLEIMTLGKTEIMEEYLTIASKKHIFVSHKAPLKDPTTGKVIGILGVSIDITKQKELERAYLEKTLELTQALEVKDNFLNNMDHEIRTPLQGIVGMADVLESAWDTLSDDKKRNCVKGIFEARDRLMNLLSNLLDLSSLRKGRAAFDFKYYDIKLLVIDVVGEFQHITQPIDLRINAGVDLHISCDEWRLKQVIRNVIANAVKHGGKDKPITISLTTHIDKKSRYLKIAIQDAGVGIPENELEAIFDPFVESKRTKRMSGGTGIGLAICKDIVTAHKGQMWAENNKKAGSTFYITLPYEKQSQQVYTFRLTRQS